MQDFQERFMYRPAPRRHRRNAHARIEFYLAWLATSAALFVLILIIIPLPKAGTQLDFGLELKSDKSKAMAAWLGLGYSATVP